MSELPFSSYHLSWKLIYFEDGTTGETQVLRHDHLGT
jgi:hypothetical protein